jgi:Na+/alanine symporter
MYKTFRCIGSNQYYLGLSVRTVTMFASIQPYMAVFMSCRSNMDSIWHLVRLTGGLKAGSNLIKLIEGIAYQFLTTGDAQHCRLCGEFN